MTKICIIGPSRKFFSGISAHTIYLANAFSGDNEVSALTMRNLLPKFLYPGTKNVGRNDFTIEFKTEVIKFEEMDWNSPLSWYKAYRFLKKEKPELIIMAWWSSAVAHMELFLALANSLKIKASLILDMHEIVDPLENSKPILKLYSRLMGRLIMNNTQAFVVHSATVKELAVSAYHLKENKVFVIPMGVYNHDSQGYTRETARNALGIKENFTILYFGMIRKYKGIPFLVEAFNKLSQEAALNSRLIIAGEDWGDEKELADLIASSPNKSRITFKPEFIPDTDVPKYFSAADVIVLPYTRSSGSGVASLAMAYGKPIIITDLENTKEALEKYKGTFFVPCGDSSCIAEKICNLYSVNQDGKEKTYDVPDSCGWDQVTESFLRVFKEKVL